MKKEKVQICILAVEVHSGRVSTGKYCGIDHLSFVHVLFIVQRWNRTFSSGDKGDTCGTSTVSFSLLSLVIVLIGYGIFRA